MPQTLAQLKLQAYRSFKPSALRQRPAHVSYAMRHAPCTMRHVPGTKARCLATASFTYAPIYLCI